MKSIELVLLICLAAFLLLSYYNFSLQDLLDSIFPHTEPCPDKDRDGLCDIEKPTASTTSTTLSGYPRVTASASLLALTEEEYKSVLGDNWKNFKEPYFMPAGEASYGKYVQDIYDGSKVIIENKNTSVTFSPKRRIRIYTEVYKTDGLPLGAEVFDARGQEDWEPISENVYKKNYNPASPESLNVDYEIYYRNINVLIVAENLEILYIGKSDELALKQLEKIKNITPST